MGQRIYKLQVFVMLTAKLDRTVDMFGGSLLWPQSPKCKQRETCSLWISMLKSFTRASWNSCDKKPALWSSVFWNRISNRVEYPCVPAKVCFSNAQQNRKCRAEQAIQPEKISSIVSITNLLPFHQNNTAFEAAWLLIAALARLFQDGLQWHSLVEGPRCCYSNE